MLIKLLFGNRQNNLDTFKIRVNKIIFILNLILLTTNRNILPQTMETKVQGFITDIKTNERLVNVTVSIGGVGVAESNDNGYFELFVPIGSYKITAQLLGYEKQIKKINIEEFIENKKVFFKLLPKEIALEEVTISGERFTKNRFTKTYELKSGDLQKIPQFGEPDALRALQSLPGITSINDFSTQLFVKGGNFDETLISLDNAPVYNPYHLGGIFSMFTSEIISEQKLYPINYPSKYGNYLSSVLEISTKDGNRDKLKGSVSLSLISSSLFLEAPIGKGSVIFSARRTYLDLVAKIISENLPYYFYDIFAKYTLPIDNKNLFSISYFYSKDVFEVFNDFMYEQPKVESEPVWGNNVININYTHLFSSKSLFDANFYFSNSFNKANATSLYKGSPNRLYLNNSLADISGKVKFNYQFTGNKFEIGVELKNINLNYNWDVGKSNLSEFGFDLENSFFDFAEAKYNRKNNVKSISTYISDNIIFTKSLSAKLNFRQMNN